MRNSYNCGWSQDCTGFNIDSINASWDEYLASPADFAVADDIIINLAKEREPGVIERTP